MGDVRKDAKSQAAGHRPEGTNPQQTMVRVWLEEATTTHNENEMAVDREKNRRQSQIQGEPLVEDVMGSRRHSVAPLLETGKTPDVISKHVHKHGPVTKDDKELESSKKKPPLLPLDPVEGVAIGLELLFQASYIFIRQHTESEDALFGVESVNRYDILDESFNRMYYAWESESTGCGSSHGYTVRVVDFSGRPVLVIRKRFSWGTCIMKTINCCGSYGAMVHVTLPDGNRLGIVKQNYNGCTPIFNVKDECGKQCYTIRGPAGGDWCNGCNMCFSEVVFRIYETDSDDEVGIITKEWSSLFQNTMKNSDLFGVRLPSDVPASHKAIFIGAVFNIDAVYFQNDAAKEFVMPNNEEVKDLHIMEKLADYPRDYK